MAISFVALTALYLGVYYTVHEYFSLTQIPVTPWSIALCVVLTDLAYYFEHRFSHRVGIAWATYTVASLETVYEPNKLKPWNAFNLALQGFLMIICMIGPDR